MDNREDAYRTVVGTPLRDGATDPEPDDFLGPINAGTDDPDVPVVSPQIHASSGQAVKPGPVFVSDPAAQDAAEKEFAQAIYIDKVPVPDASGAGDPDYAVSSVFAEQPEGDRVGNVNPDASGGQDTTETSSAPAESALKVDWIDYAVSRGATRETAEQMTKTELIEAYGK